MAKNTTQFDYEILVRYMLPKGMLDTFEVTNVEEECTGLYDETNTEIRILHIYLDERDLRGDVWQDLETDCLRTRWQYGFTKEDFKGNLKKGIRYIRMRVRCSNPLPVWHPYFGKPAGTMIDEITVE